MTDPDDRKYSREHEWLLVDGDTALIGITAYAQDQLGDIVWVDLPPVASEVSRFKKMGEIESVKSVSELFSPATGEVLETNGALLEHPELVNNDPYGEGWLLRIRLTGTGDAAEGLLSAAEYAQFVGGIDA